MQLKIWVGVGVFAALKFRVNRNFTTGAFFALPFAPFLSDRIGRKKTLFTGAVIMCAGVTLQTISANIAQFIAARGLSKLTRYPRSSIILAHRVS